MNQRRGLRFLLSGILLAGCGSSSGNPPDAAIGHDAKSDGKTDAAPTNDSPIVNDLLVRDVATALESAAPDVPGPADAPALDVPVDVVTAVDAGAAQETQVAIDASGLDAAAIDTTAAEGGTGEAGVAVTFIATLSGAQEVPPVATSASGSATFTLSADRTQLAYHVTHDVVGGTASHIHLAAAGENGAVIHPFAPFATDMSGTLTITSSDADNLAQGRLYVNVHSTANPGGEIRGQILRPGDTLWVAHLTGGQETPAITSTGTGSAALILDGTGTSLRYHVTTTGLTLTNAHIHKAIATIAGGVLYPLTPLGATIDGTVAVTSADAQDLADGHLYVNVHTAAHPGGELRGQLMLPGEVLYSATLDGANEVPPVTTSATGGAQFILDPAGTMLRYEAGFTGLTATASHIHTGAAGSNGAVVYPLTLTAAGAKGTQAVTAADITSLDAAGYYINAHTAANPGGEIRGQILKP